MKIGDLAADAERRASVPSDKQPSLPEPSHDSLVGAIEALLILGGSISGETASHGDLPHDGCGLKRRPERHYFIARSHERAPTGLTTGRMEINIAEEHVEEKERAKKRRHTRFEWGY
jgi:hypothetical protein